MKKYLVEFIGTFFLVLTVVLVVNNGTPPGFAPIAIGSILMIMIYAGGHISGAHFNPAVTVGVCLRGACSWADAPGYIIGQLLGGFLAALVGEYLVTQTAGGAMPATAAVASFVPAALAEFLGTFALVWVVIQTATTKNTSGNSYYGLAIGFTVTACAYALGPISGGAFNPAVAVGVVTAGMAGVGAFGYFLLGQLLAAVAAAFAFKFVYDGDDA